MCFRKYSLSGSYRKILQIPQDLSWKILRYRNKTDDLIVSDIDEIRCIEPLKDNPGMQITIINSLLTHERLNVQKNLSVFKPLNYLQEPSKRECIGKYYWNAQYYFHLFYTLQYFRIQVDFNKV